MLADQVDYVVGVDTHRDEHVLAVVVAPTGAIVAQRSVRATARGYAQALLSRHAQASPDLATPEAEVAAVLQNLQCGGGGNRTRVESQRGQEELRHPGLLDARALR